jgi:hypothetical protein
VSKQTVPSNAQASLASANPAPTAAPQAATPKPAETKTAAEVKKPEPAAAGKAVDWPPVQPLDDTSKSKLRL